MHTTTSDCQLSLESEVTLGEFKLTNSRVAFSGRSRAHVKQKALEFWYTNQRALQMGVREFFARCRLSPDGREIVFDRGIDGSPPIG